MKKQLLFITTLFSTAMLMAQPDVTTIAPGFGPVGSNITLGGTGFNSTPSLNVVYFGATRATVNSATGSSLNVTVPFGATHKVVSVLNSSSGLAGFSNSMFHTDFSCGANLSAGSFASALNMGVAGSSERTIHTGDLDGDGRADVIVANQGGNNLNIFRNISTPGNLTAGSFGPVQNFVTNGNPFGSVVIDIDGDGKLDVVTCNYGNNNISVLRNTSTLGNISFATAVNFATGSGPYGIGAGDIDRDGKPEIVTGNYNAGGMSVLRNTSTVGNVSFAVAINYSGGGESHMVEVVDIDGDGAKDVCVASRSANAIYVYRNISSVANVSLSPAVNFATSAGGDALGAADMDGDGKLDLIVAGIQNSNVAVLRNTAVNGTITSSSFAIPVTMNTNFTSYGLSVGDITGDGKADIFLCGNSTYPVIQNLSTVGNIVLSSPIQLSGSSTGGFHTAIGDLDNDGKNDLLYAPLGGNDISIFRTLMGVLVTPNFNNVTCNNACNGSIILTTNAATSTVIWSNSANSYTLPSLCAGVYSYSLTTGTCVATGSVTITQPAAISLTTSVSNSIVCSGNSATLNVIGAGGTGTLSYLWSNNSSSLSTVVTPTANTVYSVTATDANTCIMTSTVNVGFGPNPTVTAVSSTSLLCSGSTATLTAGGASSYSWTGVGGNAQAVVSPTVNTTYTVTGIDGNGCSSTTQITQSVTVCSGIEESDLHSGFVMVYPNPSSDAVTVKLNQFTEGAVLTVYSSLGQIVYNAVLTSDVVKIDLTSFEAGLYTLLINESNQSVYSVKFVKQ
jgi:trimeric autotransporter adhesin